MDSFINLAKQGYEAYSESQSNVHKTGGQEFNSPDNTAPGSSHHSPNFNHDEVVSTANQHGSGDRSLFSSAMGFLNDNKGDHHQPVNEDEVTGAHNKAYNEGRGSELDAGSLGSAAALQALKHFTSGGGGSQNQLISMAMAEATKLFDKSGGTSSGSKQDAVNGAAMTVVKLLVQSKLSGVIGGGNSGGLGGLMKLASHFT